MQENNLYGKRMRTTYQKIYQDRYDFHPKLIEYEKKKIKKNIKEMALEISDLKNLTMLNIGTGIESFIFHELGTKKIYHYDISDIPVNNLNRLNKTDSRYHNLYSKKMNMVKDKLSVPEGIDLVYLAGVVHHFLDPKKGLDNILLNMNKNARIFLRNYRTGTLIFFIADFVRKFISHDFIKDLDMVCRERFGDFPMNHVEFFNNLYTYLWGLCGDHGFVPSLHLLDKKKLDNYFESNGFENLHPHKLSEYNHDDLDSYALSQTNFIFRKKTSRTGKIYGQFPKHIDQLNDVCYRENYIVKTVEMMKAALPKLKTIDSKERIKLMVELFFIADSYRFIKVFLNGKHNIDNKKFKLLSNIKGIHSLFQKELENF